MQKNRIAAMATIPTNPPTDPAIMGIFEDNEEVEVVVVERPVGRPAAQVPVETNGSVFTGIVI
jgi:hypothetical protein